MSRTSTPYECPARSAVAGVISVYERAYLDREGYARQALAHLRRGDAGNISESSDAWPYVFRALSGVGVSNRPGSDFQGPSDTERAVHASLVLWAQHQQSRPTPVNASGVSLGQAAGVLSGKLKSDSEPLDAGVLRRWTRLVTGATFSTQMRALSQLVTLMRANNVTLDYPRLASDLRSLQHPTRRQDVLIYWARDLHRLPARAGADQPSTEVAVSAQEQE